MRQRRSYAPLAACLGLLAPAACSSAANGDGRPTPDPVVCSFDGTPGAPPVGWRVGTSNAQAGEEDALWELRASGSAPSPSTVLALVDARDHAGQAFNLCWTPDVSLADVDLTVRVQAGGGEEDQGGGPAWRIAGVNDYYVARWNPLEENFRLYSVKDGRRLQLAGASVQADTGEWHAIRVRHVGAAVTCWFDDDELLHAEDTKLVEPGAVGVWTKADATTSFDDLVVRRP